jgi:hypothetical protein
LSLFMNATTLSYLSFYWYFFFTDTQPRNLNSLTFWGVRFKSRVTRLGEFSPKYLSYCAVVHIHILGSF